MEPVERIYGCDRDNNDNALASVVITQVGMTQGLIKIVCGKSNCYAINSSLTVSIAAPAA